jgi:hypothetical protein
MVPANKSTNLYIPVARIEGTLYCHSFELMLASKLSFISGIISN